jgi:hypothetical protein
MMSFGWRPNQSCYEGAAQGQAAIAPPSPCAVPGWFWLCLGVAALAGISKQKETR